MCVTQTLTQAVQPPPPARPSASLRDPSARLGDTKRRARGMSASPRSRLPTPSAAVLRAAEASGVHANRCCNPAQGKYWHKLGEPRRVYLLRTAVKPSAVALASSGRQSQCALGALLGLCFLLPEVHTCTSLRFLSLTASS